MPIARKGKLMATIAPEKTPVTAEATRRQLSFRTADRAARAAAARAGAVLVAPQR